MLQCTAMHMIGCRLLTAAVHLSAAHLTNKSPVYQSLSYMHISTVPSEWHPVKIKNSPITSTQSPRKVGIMPNDCTTSQADTACATCGMAYRRTRRYGTDLSCLAWCTFSARNGVANFIDRRSATQKRRALVVCQHTEWTCTSRKRVFLKTASTHH